MILKATIQIIETYGFAELKCESDGEGAFATGNIKTAGTYSYTWDLGPRNGQNFWIWWDTLKAKVNLMVEADGTLIFHGECTRNSDGESRLSDTSTDAFIKRKGAPRLEDHNTDPISYIRF